MEIISIASGSSGNSTFVGVDGTKLLIDCGISASAAARELVQRQIDPCSIDALLVTHEHQDHIGGAFTYSKKFNVPVYMNLPTFASSRGNTKKAIVRHFETGAEFSLGNTNIKSFPISHDTSDPVGFRITAGEGEIVFATDLGRANNGLEEIINNARALIMDFNHDMEMLIKGPYPVFLKERIASDRGHLSNEAASTFLSRLELPNLEVLIAAHLSRTNNLPKLARIAARRPFENRKRMPEIIIADQFRPRAINLPLVRNI